MILALNILSALFEVVRTDRTVHAGLGASSVSLWGAHTLGTIASVPQVVQVYVAFFATIFGGLSACAVFVYTCLKIVRMVRTPGRKD